MDIFLEHMGLTEHQVIYGLHQNTNNFHVHIAVNRMHPDTLKVVRPNNGFDIEAAHRVVALVEHRQGWSSEENSRYTVLENGEVTRARREQTIQPRPKAQDFDAPQVKNRHSASLRSAATASSKMPRHGEGFTRSWQNRVCVSKKKVLVPSYLWALWP